MSGFTMCWIRISDHPGRSSGICRRSGIGECRDLRSWGAFYIGLFFRCGTIGQKHRSAQDDGKNGEVRKFHVLG